MSQGVMSQKRRLCCFESFIENVVENVLTRCAADLANTYDSTSVAKLALEGQEC